jgi:hypothetical protein
VIAPRDRRVFFNRTRTSRSIPARLVRERKLHLLPVYALLRTSDLAREGIDNSGSYRFADHVYRARAGGSLGIGRILDAVLLRLRAARAMRSRFMHAKAEIHAAARCHPLDRPFRVLSVPCGIARDLVEAASELLALGTPLMARATFFGIDLDPRPLALSRRLAGGLPSFRFVHGDALEATAYPEDLDVIVSTGLGEFLSDDMLVRFYATCRGALRTGGVLVTSATRRDPVSDFLLSELAELRARYREPDQLFRLLQLAGFTDVSARLDPTGLEILVVARRSPSEPLESGGIR